MLRLSRQDSLAGVPPSPPLYFAANGECSAGSPEGLTAWCHLLQADSTLKIAGSFKIECPTAVWKMKRCLYEAGNSMRKAGDLSIQMESPSFPAKHQQ